MHDVVKNNKQKCLACRVYFFRCSEKSGCFYSPHKTSKMNSSFDLNISLDSLEVTDAHVARSDRTNRSDDRDDNVQRILVPFYEKDVLMEVSKLNKRKKTDAKRSYIKMERQKSDIDPCTYLLNKDKANKARRASYLEMFRKQFSKPEPTSHRRDNEIRSISPQFGDTEIESIGECMASPTREFYNTESYNEMYYEKLIIQEREKMLDLSFEDAASKESGDMEDKYLDINNLKSVSEVTQPRRARQAPVAPPNNIKLGGLGPDLEKIKPRLERARSLQRYSEKVRMENRLKIYKMSVQADNKMKNERQTSAKAKEENTNGKGDQEKQNATYLVNKIPKEQNELKMKNYFKQKSKKIDTSKQYTKTGSDTANESGKVQGSSTQANSNGKGDVSKTETVKSDKKKRINTTSTNKSVNTVAQEPEPPVQISFLVNVRSGLRPSNILRNLEEKHRLYQAKVKPYLSENHFEHNINLN